MKILKINNHRSIAYAIRDAALVLKAGGVIVYPTDTAYGIGVNALDRIAVKKVYDIQKRIYTKPTHVVVRDLEMINTLTTPTPLAKVIYHHLMPGPITLILRKRKLVPDILTANLPTLGVRISKSNFSLELSSSVDFPYPPPSANRSGGNTPYSLAEVQKELDTSRVDLIIDAGPLQKVKPSTLLDLTGKKPKILREGPITKSYLENLLGLTIEVV